MKKSQVTTEALIFIMLILAGNNLSCRIPYRFSTYKLSATSSDGRFQIAIEEKVQTETGVSPYKLFLTANKNGAPFIEHLLIDQRHELDTSYTTQYPKHGWIQENVLWMGKKPLSEFSDTIVINKITQAQIKLVLISAGFHELLIFGFPEDKQLNLLSPSTGDSANWVAVKVFFDNGKLTQGGNTFLIKDRSKPTGKYQISIKDNHIDITSEDYEISR